jgi:hypothetical protein
MLRNNCRLVVTIFIVCAAETVVFTGTYVSGRNASDACVAAALAVTLAGGFVPVGIGNPLTIWPLFFLSFLAFLGLPQFGLAGLSALVSGVCTVGMLSMFMAEMDKFKLGEVARIRHI